MKANSIGFIGGGRITRIFLQAFTNKSVTFDSIVVYDTNKEVLANLSKEFSHIIITDSINEPLNQDMVILAIHPPVMMETLNRIKDHIKSDHMVLSLAPKISINKMSALLPGKIARMVPNATSYINEGYNPVAFDPSFTADDKEMFLNSFKVLGKTFEVDEQKLEGYAIVSAMLPTYFWFQWNKMEEIAERTGLTKEEARDTVYYTVRFADDLFFQAGISHQEVMDLIPVKPIEESEAVINGIYDTKLLGLFEKIKP